MNAKRWTREQLSNSPQTVLSDEVHQFRNTLAADTLTLSSSVLDYQYENGRRYHAFRQGMWVLMEVPIALQDLGSRYGSGLLTLAHFSQRIIFVPE